MRESEQDPRFGRGAGEGDLGPFQRRYIITRHSTVGYPDGFSDQVLNLVKIEI